MEQGGRLHGDSTENWPCRAHILQDALSGPNAKKMKTSNKLGNGVKANKLSLQLDKYFCPSAKPLETNEFWQSTTKLTD